MTQVRHRIVEFIFGAQWQSVVTVVTGQHYEFADLPHSFAVEPRIRPWKAVETVWEQAERSA